MVALDLLASTIVGALLGACLGMGAGLVPGLHANNLAQGAVAGRSLFVTVIAWVAASGAGSAEAAFPACGFLFGAALGHAFTDEIPAVFLGAPDPDTALSVLPGHRLLMAGHGAFAVRAAAAGSAIGVALSLPLVPLLAFSMGAPLHLYAAMGTVLPWLLIAVALALCLTERGRPSDGLSRANARLLAFGVLLASGALGELVMFTGVALPAGDPGGTHLLSLFAGLFGLPTLLLAALAAPAASPTPEAVPGPALTPRGTASAAAWGTGAGALVGWLPGVGAAQAAVLAAATRGAWSRAGRRLAPPHDSPQAAAEFLAMQSAAAAANLLFNLVALFALLRMRSGTMAAVSTIGGPHVELWSDPSAAPALLVALVIAAAVCLPLCYAGALVLGRGSVWFYARLNPRALALTVIGGLLALILFLEGASGLVIAAAALTLGLVPPLAGIKRVHLMGAVLVPVVVRLL